MFQTRPMDGVVPIRGGLLLYIAVQRRIFLELYRRFRIDHASEFDIYICRVSRKLDLRIPFILETTKNTIGTRSRQRG